MDCRGELELGVVKGQVKGLKYLCRPCRLGINSSSPKKAPQCESWCAWVDTECVYTTGLKLGLSPDLFSANKWSFTRRAP
jgi:hypothetical protein